MPSALLEELNTVATKIKRIQMKDIAGRSWAALAAEEDPQGREIWTLLLVKEGGGGVVLGGGERGGDARRGGGRGVGVLNSEDSGRIRWQPSLKGRMSLARPTEASEEVRESCDPCPIKVLATVGRNSWRNSKI